MMRPLAICFALALLLPAAVRAEGEQDSIARLEKQRTLLESHTGRLEAMLAEQGKRITRLKTQPAGVARDYQLGAALRENLELATKLTRQRSQLRALTQQLALAYAAAASRAGGAERARLERRRAQLAALLGSGPARIVTREKASPLDAPEDLEEKADLLQDSEEKVRRQLRQVQAKISMLERRARLERHGKALDDNPFVEDSPRRSGAARKVAAAAADSASGKSNAPSPSAMGPTSPAPPPAKYGAGAGESGAMADAADPTSSGSVRAGVGSVARTGGGSSEIISIRDVLDPAILKDPASPERGDSLRARLAALKSAGARLNDVAGKLSTQARDLRQRAKTLRSGKP